MPVRTGLLIVDLQVEGSTSLKAKRRVVRSIVDRARARHRVAAAETGYQDDRNRSEVAFVCVGSDGALLQRLLDNLLREITSRPDLTVCTHAIEIE